MGLPKNRKYANVPLRVIAIDPSSTLAGYSVIDFDFETEKSNVVFSRTANGQNLANVYFNEESRRIHGGLLSRNLSHGKFLLALLARYRPYMVVCEDAYINVKLASAFKALKENTTVLRANTFSYDPYMQFLLLAPSRVKKMMSVNGGSGDKTLMATALKKDLMVTYANGIDLSKLDSHCVDSICVGVVECRDIYMSVIKSRKHL